LTTQVCALTLHVSALASVEGNKKQSENGNTRKDGISFLPPGRFLADCFRQNRFATFRHHIANARGNAAGQRSLAGMPSKAETTTR
jgi:hypothetical protein